MGWKTIYKKKYIKMVDVYIKECNDKEEEFWKTRGDKSNTYEQWINVNLPTIEKFARWLGVSRRTLYNWRDTYPDFAEALEKIKDEQFIRLTDNGLAGKYNPIITKLILTTNHGMRDQVDATTNGESLNSFSDEQVDRIAERIARRKETDGDTSSS